MRNVYFWCNWCPGIHFQSQVSVCPNESLQPRSLWVYTWESLQPILECSCFCLEHTSYFSSLEQLKAMVPKTAFHKVTASSLQSATQQWYFYSGLMINHHKNVIVRMQSGLVHSPKSLRSTGLEEKPSGTQERTLKKQNNHIDWSRIPAFSLLWKHPGTSRAH